MSEAGDAPAVADPGRLAEYLVRGGMASVEGFCSVAAGFLAWRLSEWQARRGVRGDIAEIGVHHGRFFLALALLRRGAEQAVAIDVFDDQQLNPDGSGLGDRAAFEANLRRHLGGARGVVIHAADSLGLAGRDLLAPGLPPLAAPRRSFRLFSVDGSHTARHTRSDIELAFSVLAEGGVVIVDDFYNDQWPGVQEGVHALLAARPDIAAAAYGENKLLLVREADHAAALALFREELAPHLSLTKEVELHGRPALMFRLGSIAAGFGAGLRPRPTMAASFGLGGEDRVRLLSGWSGRERGGTWMTAPLAEAEILLPAEVEGRKVRAAQLHLNLHPLVHPGRATRRLSITTSFGARFEGEIGRRETITLDVPPGHAGTPLRLSLEGEAPEAPGAVLTGSRDMRPLSFRFGEAVIALETEAAEAC